MENVVLLSLLFALHVYLISFCFSWQRKKNIGGWFSFIFSIASMYFNSIEDMCVCIGLLYIIKYTHAYTLTYTHARRRDIKIIKNINCEMEHAIKKAMANGRKYSIFLCSMYRIETFSTNTHSINGVSVKIVKTQR